MSRHPESRCPATRRLPFPARLALFLFLVTPATAAEETVYLAWFAGEYVNANISHIWFTPGRATNENAALNAP